MNSWTKGGMSKGGPIARGVRPRRTPRAKAAPLPGAAPKHLVFGRFVCEFTQKPLANVTYDVLDAAGKRVAGGTTDWQGTFRHEMQEPGAYRVVVTGVPE